jgi:PAS domain S-box-containing protein
MTITKNSFIRQKASELKEARKNFTIDEHTFRSLIGQSEEGIAILSEVGNLLYISPSIQKILGYTVEEAMQARLLAVAHPGDVPALRIVRQTVLKNPGKAIKGHTGRMLHKDGSWRWLEATVTNMLHDPAINGIVGNFRDITERKLEEEKLVHANRLYAFISQLNQSIIHSTDEQTVFRNACNIAIEFGKFEAVWIGVIDIENQKINLVEQSGLGEKDVKLFKNILYDNKGPQSQVLRSGSYYVSNRMQTEAKFKQWKSFAVDRGYNSCLVLPIRKKETIIGTLNLYSAEPGFFNAEEIALLEEAAGDISFSLELFEGHQSKTIADETLIHSETRLKQAQSIAHLGSWEVDFATGIAVWSAEACRIYGLPTGETRQSYKSWISFIHADDLSYVLAIIKKSDVTLSNRSFFHRITRKDGTIRHLHSQSHFQFNKEGKAIGLYGVMHDITEIKETEEALRVSVAFNKEILASLSSHIAVVDNNGWIVAVNKAWKDFGKANGITSLERASEGSNYFEVCKKASASGDLVAEQALKGIQSVFSEKHTSFELEYSCDSPQQSGWFVLRVMNFGNDGSKVVISHQDISKRKNAEESLLRSQSNLEAIIENTDATIYSLDKQLRYITFNRQLKSSLERLYGLQIKTGDSVNDFLTKLKPADALTWRTTYQKALMGETVKFEKEFHIDGQLIYFSFAIYPIWENKNVVGLSCFAFNITQQKLAKEALKQSELSYRQIVETAQEGIWLVNKAHETVFVNNELCNILGYAREEMIGKNIFSFMDERDTETKKQIREIKKRVKSSHGDFKYISKPGKQIWASVSANPIFDDNGDYTGALGMISDITEKKKLEALLDKANRLSRLGSWEVDLINNKLYWSAITKQIHEVNEKFIPVFEKALQFYKPGYSRKSISNAIENAIEKNTGWDLELELITAKNNSRWVRTIGVAECADGKCTRLSGSIQDIDAMKKAEEKLKDKNNELKELSAYLQNVREAERKHIAREVHDELGQLASSLQIDVDWLGIKTEGLGENVNNRIIHANKSIKELITTIRKIAAGLRPSILDDFGLNAALHWFCNEFQQLNNVQCEYKEEFNDSNLSTEIKTELFRMSQESLTNVMRHAKAKKATVHITEDLNKIYLTVTDDGVGFDVKQRKNTLGLVGLRERAISVKGELHITSEVGKGTTISAIIPKK